MIYVSTAAWDGLGADEREAMLAHERGHVRGRDLLRRVAVEVMAIVSGPLVPAFLIGRWESATERLRDREAARLTDPDAVARALVHMVRLGAVRVAGVSFEPATSQLARRVDAVYDSGPTGEPVARRLTVLVVSSAALLAVTAALLADPLHHALETLVG